MKKITINLYKFNELSEEAKSKAVNDLSTINVDYDWWDTTYEDAKNIGLKITGFDLDRRKHATGDFVLDPIDVANNIIKEHGEKCETFSTAINFIEDYNRIRKDYDDKGIDFDNGYGELSELESEFLDSLLSDYADMLQKECEYLQSEESIIETIKANDYDFTEDGKIY